MSRVILASQSQQRRELLASLGFPFEVIPADLDELSIDHPDHAQRAAMVARAKADKIHDQYPDAIVISADTFVLLQGKRLEKPLDIEEARQMLHAMSGQEVSVLTGWAYIDSSQRVWVNDTVEARLTFRSLQSAEIENYIQAYPVTSWAGGFSLIHAPGMSLIADIRGSLTAIEGIPIEKLVPHLTKSGVLV